MSIGGGVGGIVFGIFENHGTGLSLNGLIFKQLFGLGIPVLGCCDWRGSDHFRRQLKSRFAGLRCPWVGLSRKKDQLKSWDFLACCL